MATLPRKTLSVLLACVPFHCNASRLLSAGEPAQTGAPSCTGAVCETATSTNRGFDLQWRLHYFYEGEN